MHANPCKNGKCMYLCKNGKANVCMNIDENET
jgi:hypothetical protein